ncbi:MAG TPA: YlxR family protein [Nocardioidaceae bacterium]|nr:YlxR family protein [Nocardioidaceae bacterium]
MVPQLDNSTRAAGPIRTCIGCRERTTKRELLRIVAGTDAESREGSQPGSWFVAPDPSGTARGRGAHLHPTTECLAIAERKRAFSRALRHDAGVRGALSLERLREHLGQLDQEPEPT